MSACRRETLGDSRTIVLAGVRPSEQLPWIGWHLPSAASSQAPSSSNAFTQQCSIKKWPTQRRIGSFKLCSQLDNVYTLDVTAEGSGDLADATLRDLVSGQKLFGRDSLIRILGRGGMGVVWLARDEELEREVALKFLPDLIIHDAAVLSDLKRETRHCLELTHKNIVRIYDFVHDERSGCISMEYIDGDTLSSLRCDKERKVFEVAELTDWMSQLCDALDYAHNYAHIIHRDLKPANLMVNQRGELKVSDF